MADGYSTETTDTSDTKADLPPAEEALVKKIIDRVTRDRNHHKDAFKRMREDMEMARTGADSAWNADNYRANLAGRHVKNKTAALYAKNPKAAARRRETLDFTVWDEDPQSLDLAMKTLMAGQQMIAQLPPELVRRD